jgi:uncharacterized membrane-anchored protein
MCVSDTLTMTGGSNMCARAKKVTAAKIMDDVAMSRHVRLPVYDETALRLVCYASARDVGFVTMAATNEGRSVSNLLSRIIHEWVERNPLTCGNV